MGVQEPPVSVIRVGCLPHLGLLYMPGIDCLHACRRTPAHGIGVFRALFTLIIDTDTDLRDGPNESLRDWPSLRTESENHAITLMQKICTSSPGDARSVDHFCRTLEEKLHEIWEVDKRMRTQIDIINRTFDSEHTRKRRMCEDLRRFINSQGVSVLATLPDDLLDDTYSFCNALNFEEPKHWQRWRALRYELQRSGKLIGTWVADFNAEGNFPAGLRRKHVTGRTAVNATRRIHWWVQ